MLCSGLISISECLLLYNLDCDWSAWKRALVLAQLAGGSHWLKVIKDANNLGALYSDGNDDISSLLLEVEFSSQMHLILQQQGTAGSLDLLAGYTDYLILFLPFSL